jgi:hypothetical protein
MPGTFGRPTIISETLPGAKQFIENGFRDPSDVEGTDKEKLDAFREVRDEIIKWLIDYFSKTS